MLTEGSDRWAGREQLERYLSTWRNSRTELGFCRIMEGGGGVQAQAESPLCPHLGQRGAMGQLSRIQSSVLELEKEKRKEKK